MVFLDFLFNNSGDELNFPFTIKMFQKIILTKVSHLEISKMNLEFSIFALLMQNRKKIVRNWLLEGIKNYNRKINLLNYFQFRPKCGDFQNI